MKFRAPEGFVLILMLAILSAPAFFALADAPEIDVGKIELAPEGDGTLPDDESLILEDGAVPDDDAFEAELALDGLLDIQLSEDMLIGGTDGAALAIDGDVAMNGGGVQARLEETTDSVTASDGMDNDALFDAWMKQALPGMRPRRSMRSAHSGRASLDGINLKLYDALAPMIREVANGTRTSTKLPVDDEAAGVKDSWWTAEQLGLESLDDRSLGNALLTREGFDQSKILQALLLDCPYDLYWFDKMTGGMGWSFNPYKSGGKARLTNLTANMAVAADYSRTGAVKTYEMNDRPARVSVAVDNINGIVNDNRNRDDLSKLKAYANVICGLVDYNTDAANDSNAPYGDPWQLVCIFDNDDSTKVVCEGYSKGFKYLCDLSDFDGDVACELMSGSIPAGNHMWNAVRMPDGYCYPVDLTNSDGGGFCNERIFLKACTEQTDASFRCETITYTYSDKTLASFPRAWLTMSGFNYGSMYTALGYSGDYDGNAHGIVVSPADEAYTVRYGAEMGNYNLTESPAWKDAGEYTVYFCVGSGDSGTVEGRAKVSIAPKTVGLNWGNAAFTYDGTSHAPEAVVSDVISGDLCTVMVTGAQRDAGSYTAAATGLSNENYRLEGTLEKAFTISQRTASLAWGNTGLTYNGKAQAPVAKVGNLVKGDSCTVTVTGARRDAGRYTATATALSNGNYALPKPQQQTFVIAPRTVRLKWTGTSLTYNGMIRKPSAKAVGLVPGDECEVTVKGGRKNAGNYTAKAVRLSNANYALPETRTKACVIKKKTIRLKWTQTRLKYNGKKQKPTATAVGLVEGDTCRVTVSGAQRKKGDHTATAVRLSNRNYQLPGKTTVKFRIY